MSLLNIFKTRWSSRHITPQYRRVLFWLLQRKTSVTAWQREADAFEAFAQIFEKQVIEEPTVTDLYPVFQSTDLDEISFASSQLDWAKWYPGILKTREIYHKGLSRLQAGERSVFLLTRRGALTRHRVGKWWHEELVLQQGGEHSEAYSGKYLSAMRSALKTFWQCSQDTGYVQTHTGTLIAPEYWSPALAQQLDELQAQLDRCQIALPTLPQDPRRLRIKTGHTVPVFGIYEPQVRDGCMNYLLQDTPAPLLRGYPRDVTWKLLWEDTRYTDGRIPAEERDYFGSEWAQTAARPRQD